MSFFDMPAGMNDADVEMTQLEYTGDRATYLKRKGICLHGQAFTPDHGPSKCLECGKEFPSAGHFWAERDELRVEYM